MSYESWSNPNVSAAKGLKDMISDAIDMPIPNFNFSLIVEGVMHVPCKSVDSIVRENEYDNIQEGGVNDYVLMRRKPITKPFTFSVERYAMTYLSCYDPLQEGADLVLPLILLVTPAVGSIAVTRRAYVFTGCTVISKEYGSLNAEQSGLLTERTTIGYRELMVVSVPPIIEKLAVKEWKFGSNYKGENGSRREGSEYGKTDTYALQKDSTGEGENRGWAVNQNKWRFNGKSVEGKNNFGTDEKPDIIDVRRMAPKTTDSTYALPKETSPATDADGNALYVNGGWAANPNKWAFNNKDSEGNGKRRMKGKDTASSDALDKDTAPTTDSSGQKVYANGGYVVNRNKWQFNKKDPVGEMPELTKKNADGSTSTEPTDIRKMAPYDVSTYAIGKPVEKQINPGMWNIKKADENRRMEGKDTESTYAVDMSQKDNPEMWRFDEKKEKGNGNQSARPDVSVEVPKDGRRLWKFDRDKNNFKGTGQQSAKTSFEIKNI